jgi:hypothetical protein
VEGGLGEEFRPPTGALFKNCQTTCKKYKYINSFARKQFCKQNVSLTHFDYRLELYIGNELVAVAPSLLGYNLATRYFRANNNVWFYLYGGQKQTFLFSALAPPTRAHAEWVGTPFFA